MSPSRWGLAPPSVSWHEGDGELRLILVGKSGGGKSAMGNTLLGREEFESVLAANATTLQCQKAQGSWSGRRVSVVDTPDFFPLGAFRGIVYSEIWRCVELSRPGPHALVFVTQVGRFTAEDEAAANRVLDLFGVEAARRMMVLFTRKEYLGGSSLQDYVRRSGNQALQKLAQRCGDRVCAFNNGAVGAECEEHVSELVQAVLGIVQENGGSHCVNPLYSASNPRDEAIRSLVRENRKARRKAELAELWRSKRRFAGILLGIVFTGIVVLVPLVLRLD
ncbi:GTPase IMAP family member 2-like [Varanus komodoensis]|uniref:GTPase IMAP family member 2-like n=1 Tax=Varanus komodoensis TaxID=61221 RepID=UPI001CF7A9FE|nr:GTPase IMAP family member 2-like [Varanus komodoensis]